LQRAHTLWVCTLARTTFSEDLLLEEGPFQRPPVAAASSVRGAGSVRHRVRIIGPSTQSFQFLENLMRTKEQLERAKLSPFLETAFGQLLAELPKTREGYELCKRIETRVIERRKQIWTRKTRPSKRRKRSTKEIADRQAWYQTHVEGKTVYKSDWGRNKQPPDVQSPSSTLAAA
jgi:hypothetical protein